MRNAALRQKRINQELAELPFASRTPRVQNRQQNCNFCNYDNDTIRKKRGSKKKLRSSFYEGDTSESYYIRPPFSLNSKNFEDDYDTIEAHARFCKSKIPGQDINETEKMNFFLKMKKENYIHHYNTYFDQEKDSYDLNHNSLFDIIRNKENKSKASKYTKSPTLKKYEGSYPSFCRPYHDRIQELIEKEMSIQNKTDISYSQIKDDQVESTRINDNFSVDINDIEVNNKNLAKKKRDYYTPNIHVTRRVKSYYIANNMEIPDFLQRINPVPLRYDRIVHYHPDPT